MDPALPLDQMTVEEKLKAMEEIWEDLTRTPEKIPSPDWHGDILKARADRVRDEGAKFNSWPEAKKRIKDKI